MASQVKSAQDYSLSGSASSVYREGGSLLFGPPKAGKAGSKLSKHTEHFTRLDFGSKKKSRMRAGLHGPSWSMSAPHHVCSLSRHGRKKCRPLIGLQIGTESASRQKSLTEIQARLECGATQPCEETQGPILSNFLALMQPCQQGMCCIPVA